MIEGLLELESREFRQITNKLDNATKDVTGVFNEICSKVLTKRGIEGFRPPFEVVIGCGGLATRLAYWVEG